MPQPKQTGALRKPIGPGPRPAFWPIDHLTVRTTLPCTRRPELPGVETVAQQATRTVAWEPQTPHTPIGGRRGRDHAMSNARLCLGVKPLVALDSIAVVISCHRGQEVYRQTDAIDHWYRVLSGLAKEHALLADGRHQIVNFLLPGDFFGFGARNQHQFTVEVVVDGTVLASYPRREAEMLAERDPSVARLICAEAFETLSRTQARMLTLGRTSAPQKVGAFLLEMAERLAGGRGEAVSLPMSRYDIADYLGLSVEAVSRSLTKLKCLGVIRLAGTRCVSILDRDALDWR
jgi:CRP/FNR family nitrogen fixation transcriptional regulator